MTNNKNKKNKEAFDEVLRELKEIQDQENALNPDEDITWENYPNDEVSDYGW